MSERRVARLVPVWSVALGWAVLDQLVKTWALQALWAAELEVIPGLLWFNLIRNPGAAFGLFPRGHVFLIPVGLLLIGVGFWAPFVMTGRRWSAGQIGLGFLVGGGIGNLVDRIFRGGLVVDFIDVRVWPIFNLADSGIVIGTTLVLIYLVGSLLRADGEKPA